MYGPAGEKGPTLIDLFAGCGGLSLGLERAGFRPVFVNELDSDAMDTYLRNRSDNLGLRRFHAADIFELTGDWDPRRSTSATLNGLKEDLRPLCGSEVDLVAGGPPCQGYSGIGHRRSYGVDRADIPSNHLYREMAKVVRAIRPRLFLFENVRGLMSARWTPDGEPGEIWRDVVREFCAIDGYSVRWDVLHAKRYGVPQNRPRILLVGIRDDVASSALWSARDDWAPRDGSFADGLLPRSSPWVPPDPQDFLGDLVDPDYRRDYVTERYPLEATTEAQVWLRTGRDGVVAPRGELVFDQEYSRHSDRIVAKFQYMLTHNGEVPEGQETKKFAQRVIPATWGAKGPTITSTSLPDDYVHFAQPRTLTVREWARTQTFPDWYLFSGNRTTGGSRRAGNPHEGNWHRELPKYTQIGNAVPVRLAEAIGMHFRGLIA